MQRRPIDTGFITEGTDSIMGKRKHPDLTSLDNSNAESLMSHAQVQIGNTAPYSLTYVPSYSLIQLQSDRDERIEESLIDFNLEDMARRLPPLAPGYQQLQINYGGGHAGGNARAYIRRYVRAPKEPSSNPNWILGPRRYLHASPWTAAKADEYVTRHGEPNLPEFSPEHGEFDPSYSIFAPLFASYFAPRYRPREHGQPYVEDLPIPEDKDPYYRP